MEIVNLWSKVIKWSFPKAHYSLHKRLSYYTEQVRKVNVNNEQNQILTQNDHSRSFKVIRFGVSEEPLRGYIVQYNNCGLECEGSEDIASERSENRHLRRRHSHLTPPLQRTPANIYMNLTLLETKDHCATFFIADSMWVALQIFEQFCPKSRNANS